jgi:pimeloyl-ACP methyl ester carboxylesterase
MKTILFLHGFASSTKSTKAQYLGHKFDALPGIDFYAIDFNPTISDFEHVTTTGLINRVRQFVLDYNLEPFSIIGSSYGGLVALHYAHRFGEVQRMLLLAPGLRWLSGGLSEAQLQQWKEAGVLPAFHHGFKREVPVHYELHLDGLSYLEPLPPPTPVTIIHGRSDTTVPVDDSRKFAERFPDQVHLVEVDADHDLNEHLDLIWEHVQSFLLSS